MNQNIHQFFQQTRKLFEPLEHRQTNDKAAREILDELGVESVPASHYNDDDWYTYSIETLELQAGRGSHYSDPGHPDAPWVTVRGLRAKRLGLWRYKAVQA